MPEKLPDLPEPLVKALDRLFPERSPDPKWSFRKVWIEAGKREVVRFLIEQHRQQTQSSHVQPIRPKAP